MLLTRHMCGGQDNLREFTIFFHPVRPGIRDETQVVRLGDKPVPAEPSCRPYSQLLKLSPF